LRDAPQGVVPKTRAAAQRVGDVRQVVFRVVTVDGDPAVGVGDVEDAGEFAYSGLIGGGDVLTGVGFDGGAGGAW